MASNPRIEELRKRIEKEPGSRLFAQLAEELRKDGELEDAIRVARAGLQTHPNYPSARMTLGRALLDTGDWASARSEFEQVLKGAADNILASRYLAECFENLGQRDAAIKQYKATLAMAPGEKHVVARLHELEGTTPTAAPIASRTAGGPATGAFRPTTGLRPGTATLPLGEKASRAAAPAVPLPAPPAPAVLPRPLVAAAPTPADPPPAPVAAPPPPIPLATVDGEMVLETSRSAPAPAAPAPAPADGSRMAPIPLVAADEEFELERPYESPTTSIGSSAASAPAAPPPMAIPAATTPAPAPASNPPLPAVATPWAATAEAVPPKAAPAPEIGEEEFELEAPHAAPTTGWEASIRPLPVVEDAPAPAPRPAAPPMAAPTGGPASLISPTLGELYFNQGFTDKAIEVYRELSAREPANDRLSARLRELEKLQGALAGGETAVAAAPASASGPPPAAPTPTAVDGAPADRRQAIERTIVRLEGLLSAIRKG